ncbi:MAG: hypothetical protein WCJ70_01990 [bacterium]
MSHNFTPVDLARFLSAPPDPTKSAAPKTKGFSFDKVFLPFSVAILLMSLTFYGMRYLYDSSQAKQVVTNKATLEVISAIEPSVVPTTPIVAEKIYSSMGQIEINTEKLTASARAQYPNFTDTQLSTTVNKSLLEWAALRQYFKPDKVVFAKLKINVSKPLESFSDINKDLGVLIVALDKKDDLGKPPVAQLVEEYKKVVEIK